MKETIIFIWTTSLSLSDRVRDSVWMDQFSFILSEWQIDTAVEESVSAPLLLSAKLNILEIIPLLAHHYVCAYFLCSLSVCCFILQRKNVINLKQSYV